MTRLPVRVKASAAIVAAIAAMIAPLKSATAKAHDPDGVVAATVRLGDLRLASEHDAGILYERIRLAAEVVCAPFEGKGLTSDFRRRACIRSAVLKAVKDVDRPTLTAVHKLRSL